MERMKRGFKRVGEIKEQFQKSRLKSAEKRLERQKRYAKVYEAEAKVYEAAAKKEASRQKFSRLRMGSFGETQQPFGIDMGLKQVQQPKRKKQPSIDDELIAFMRR